MNSHTPVSRGRACIPVKTPYGRVNAIKKHHPNLQEIIKNCPALDVIFDYDNPRSSTHLRSRGRDKEHVARPPNAFMVYRSYMWYTKQVEIKGEKNLSCVSQLAARSWRVMSEKDRTPFKLVADIAKREHAERNPDYKYAPSQKKPSQQASKAKVKVKVKQTTTLVNGGFVGATPSSKEAQPARAGTTCAAPVVDASPTSSVAGSPSSCSSPSPSTSPVPRKRRMPHYSLPPTPRLFPISNSAIGSPTVSAFELDLDDSPGLDGFRHTPDETVSPFLDSGDPEVEFGSPTPSAGAGGVPEEHPSSIGGYGYFSDPTSPTGTVDYDLDLMLSPGLRSSSFDMSTVGFDRVVDKMDSDEMNACTHDDIFEYLICAY